MLEGFHLSKSSAETFLSCGLKFSKKYIEKIIGNQKLEDKEASEFGNLIHDILENKFGKEKDRDVLEMFKEGFAKYPLLSKRFYDLGAFLLEDYVSSSAPKNKVLGLELPFQFYLDNGVPVKGIIDRVDEISDTEIEITDYKTGYSQPLNPDEMKEDIQIGMYNLAIKQLYPGRRIKSTLNYLHFGKVSVYLEEKDLESLKGYLGVIYEKIQKAVETGQGLEPRINSFCGYCEYKSQCSLYKETVLKENKDLTTFNAMILPENGITVDVEKLDLFHDMVKGKIKLLKSIDEKVKSFIGDMIKNTNTGKVIIGKTPYKLTAKKFTDYKVEDVIALAKEKGYNLNEVLSVQKGNVDAKLKDDLETWKKLKANAETGFGKSYVQ